MLSLVRPEWFIPVHGEFRHLVHHARLAEAVGVPSDHVCICVDGDVVTLGADGARRRTARGARRATSTSTGSSTTSPTACCATAATSPRRAWSWCS